MRARKISYHKIHWVNFFAETMDLSGFERSIYLVLLGQYFITGGPLRDDDRRLASFASISVEQWLALRPAIARHFQVRSRYWRHAAMDRDIAQANAQQEARVRAGKANRAKVLARRSAEAAAQQRTQATHPQSEFPSQSMEALPGRLVRG